MTARKKPRGAYHHGDLRSALIAAATKLVREDGAASFSLREAARAVGVDAAACYRHFRDRQEVLLAIAQLGFTKLARAFTEGAAHVDGSRHRLDALGRAYVTFALRHPAEFRVMFGESGLHARDDRLRAPELERTAYEQLEGAVAAHVDEEQLPIAPAKLTMLLWSLAHGVARLVLDGAVPLTEAQAHALLAEGTAEMLAGVRGRRRTARRSAQAARAARARAHAK